MASAPLATPATASRARTRYSGLAGKRSRIASAVMPPPTPAGPAPPLFRGIGRAARSSDTASRLDGAAHCIQGVPQKPRHVHLRDPELGGKNFLRLLGRAYADPAPFIRRFLSEQYAQMIARFKLAFGRALPHLPAKELSWRLHFIMGALSYTLAGTDALKLIAELNPKETTNDEVLLRRLAPFLLAGLKAPLPDLSEVSRELDAAADWRS